MIAKGSLHWVLTPLILSIVLLSLFFYYGLNPFILILVIILIFFTVGFAIFFRDPNRKIGKGLVAPADGIIKDIKVQDNFVNISTFMNLHNVHVNRAPIDGTVKKIEHVSGTYVPAYKTEASMNEKLIIILDTKIGEVGIIQIAGILARRLVSYIKEGENLTKGQRIGMIRFGSRVDLYLPRSQVKLLISKNMKVKAGISTLAEVIDEMG